MKRVGVTGPPGSGKSTLVRAIGGGTAKGDVTTVSVPDERLDALVEMHSSRKTVPARIEVVDVHAAARTHASAIAKLREMDAILLVTPSFSAQDPALHVSAAIEDLILADLQPVETRLERAKKDASAKREIPALERAKRVLEEGRRLSQETWASDELTTFSSLTLVTQRPIVVVFNADEHGLEQSPPPIEFPSFVASAPLEAEVAGMGAEEAGELLRVYGIKQTVLGRVIDAVYRSLDLISFFTTSDKESRAWEVRSGAKAPEAAGVIHSDMQRGFIRAEVISFQELEEIGHWDAAKAQGRIRVEGKDYVLQEGDVTHFRFSI